MEGQSRGRLFHSIVVMGAALTGGVAGCSGGEAVDAGLADVQCGDTSSSCEASPASATGDGGYDGDRGAMDVDIPDVQYAEISVVGDSYPPLGADIPDVQYADISVAETGVAPDR